MRISEIYFSLKKKNTHDGLTHNLFIIKILGNFVVDLSFKKLLHKKNNKNKNKKPLFGALTHLITEIYVERTQILKEITIKPKPRSDEKKTNMI